jgi:large subunit ribosomal protein L29
MKAAELREMSGEELAVKLGDLNKEAFNLRFQLTIGDIENPMRIREVRKDIARIKTILKVKVTG